MHPALSDSKMVFENKLQVEEGDIECQMTGETYCSNLREPKR